MKKTMLLLLAVILCLLTGCAGKDENTAKKSKLPLYYELEKYEGEKPVYTLGGEICIPTEALGISDSDEKAFEIEGIPGSYIKLSDLEIYGFVCHVSSEKGNNGVYVRRKTYDFDYSWTESGLIAHALGGINGYAYTNSYEAFITNYELGHRVFEVDFMLTSDGKLVCTHSFENDIPVDYETFMAGTFSGFSHIDIDTIIGFMRDYPDIVLITDSKETESDIVTKQFEIIVEAANEAGCPEVLDRIVPQIYHEEMLDTIMSVYEWKSMIYTLYLVPEETYSEEEIATFSYLNGIGVVTMQAAKGNAKFLAKLNSLDIRPYVHTYNTEKEKKQYFSKGFKGLYTDFLTP